MSHIHKTKYSFALIHEPATGHIQIRYGFPMDTLWITHR